MSTYKHSVVMSSEVSLVSDLRAFTKQGCLYGRTYKGTRSCLYTYCMANNGGTTRHVQAKQTINFNICHRRCKIHLQCLVRVQ